MRQAQPAAGLVPACAIQDDDGMGARGDVATDLGEMQVHRLGVGIGQDKGCCCAACGTNGTEQISPVVALVARCGGSGAAFGPDPGQCALLPDAGFILPPDFDRLAARVLRDGCHDQIGKVFLCASCAARFC